LCPAGMGTTEMGVRKLLSSMWVGEGTADQAAEAVATSATGETQKDSVSPGSSSPGMRRNLTASAALSAVGGDKPLTSAERESVTTAMRRNTSASTLSELRRREQSAKGTPGLEGSCAAVVEAVACKLLELVLGKAAMLEAMRECTPSTIPEGSDEKGSDERRRRSSGEDCATSGSSSSGGGGGGGGSGCSSGAGTTAATIVPPGIASSLQGYIMTIVKHLELPNSCIVAALIYVLRAVDGSRFSLSLTNWQPCLLAAFVISAKLSFDEPVWNEDFVKALRISNVQVSQISRWEADFLLLLSFNTNVTAAQYAAACFDLQKAHEELHGRPCHFFTYLMSLSNLTPAAGS